MGVAGFDHAIRAAGSILGESEILVIGSQAIHGSIAGDLPAEAERSVEVDSVAFDDANARKADLIDGSIGEASTFQVLPRSSSGHRLRLFSSGQGCRLLRRQLGAPQRLASPSHRNGLELGSVAFHGQCSVHNDRATDYCHGVR